MSLPELFKTWSFKKVTVAAQGSANASCVALMIALKDALIGAGTWNDISAVALPGAPSGKWTLLGSSDGTNAAIDGVDRWTSVGAIDLAHTPWVYLQSPTGLRVVFGLPLVSIQSMHIMIARTAFTGGTRDAYPTSTTGIFALQSTTWGGPATNIPTSLLCELATDGTARLVMCRNGVQGMWLFEKVADPSSGWLYPAITLCFGNTGTGDTSIWPTGSTKAIGHNNAGSVVNFDICEPAIDISGTLISQTVSTANPNNSKWPMMGLLVYANSGSDLGIYGHLEDAFFGADANPTGDCYDDTAATTRRFIQLLRWVLPWDTTNPTINPGGSEPSKTIRNAEYSATISSGASSAPFVENFAPPNFPSDEMLFDTVAPGADWLSIHVSVGTKGGRPTTMVHRDVDGAAAFSPPFFGERVKVDNTRYRYHVRSADGWDVGRVRLFVDMTTAGGSAG